MIALWLCLFFSAMVTHADTASLEQHSASGQISEIETIHGPWIVDFYPNGAVHLQYGALAGDGAKVPEGTVHFDALLTAVMRLKAQKAVTGGTQVAISRQAESSATAFYISDDTVFRSLIASLQDKWQPEGARFKELLQTYPIYPK